MRLFVALDLPAEVRSALAALPVGDGWRRVREESLHVTLAFLGEVEDPGPVVEAVVPRPITRLVLERAVLLPPRRPRVMAVTLGGDMSALQSSIASALGIDEQRPFLPHVTIGRARGRPSRELPEVPRLEFTAPSVSVYRSFPGSRYEALATFPLR